MLLIAMADGFVAFRLGIEPLRLIPWRRYVSWNGLILLALASGFLALPFHLPDALGLSDKLGLIVESAVRAAISLGLLMLGAIWIGHGNLSYLFGIKGTPTSRP